MTFTYWLQFIAAFLIVLAVLIVAACVVEWWKSQKETR